MNSCAQSRANVVFSVVSDITDPDPDATTPTPTGPPLVAVPLYQSCQHHEVCADAYAVCVNGTCLCQTSYFEKDLVCCEYGYLMLKFGLWVFDSEVWVRTLIQCGQKSLYSEGLPQKSASSTVQKSLWIVSG